MNCAVIYYSFSGNTQKVARVLSEYLKQKGGVDLIELKAPDESKNFFNQAGRAIKKKRVVIDPVKFDLKNYDLVCFGTPTWAFSPAPAMNTYLDKCSGLESKEAILFSTYGSGAGNERCLNYMQGILIKKGAKNFRRFSIQQGKVDDGKFVLEEIMRLWPNG